MKIALAFEEWVMSHIPGVVHWVGGLTGTHAAWLGVGIVVIFTAGYYALRAWLNGRDDEAYDADWMSLEAWEETR